MSLPLEQEMAIHLSYLEHRAAVAEGFAKLRARLLPEPPPEAGYLGALGSMSGQAWLQAQMQAQGSLVPIGYLANPFMTAPNTMTFGDMHRLARGGGFWPWG